MEKMRQWRYGAEALQPESHAFGPEQRINLGHGGEPAGRPQSRRARGHCNPGNVLQQCLGVRMKKVLLLLGLLAVFALGQVVNDTTVTSPLTSVGSSTQSDPMAFIGS